MKSIRRVARTVCLAAAAYGGVHKAYGAVVSWTTDVNGNWSVASNWSSNPSLPGSADDVVISRPGAPTVVTFSFPNSTVFTKSVTLDNTLEFFNGELRASTNVAVNGTLTVRGGNAVINTPLINMAGAGQVFVNSAAHLDYIGATVNGNTVIAAGGAVSFSDAAKNHGTVSGDRATVSFAINNAPVMQDIVGNLALTNSLIVFQGPIANTGQEIVLDGQNGNRYEMSGSIVGGKLTGTNGGTVTFANATLSNVTLNVGGTAANELQIANRVTLENNVNIDAQGQLKATSSGTLQRVIDGNGRFTLKGQSSGFFAGNVAPWLIDTGVTLGGSGEMNIGNKLFTNRGTIVADNPLNELRLNITSASSVLNQGTILVDSGALLSFDSVASGINQSGSIVLKNGTLQVMNFTTRDALGDVISTAQGRVVVKNAVDNTGRAISLDANDGTWRFERSITGGTLNAASGSRFVLGGEGTGFATFDLTNVQAINAPVTIPSQSLVRVTGNVPLNGKLTITGDAEALSATAASFTMQGSTSLTGLGTVDFGANVAVGASARGYLRTTGVLTIGPQVTIVSGAANGTVTGTIINNGMISAATPARYLELRGTVTNNGHIEARDGGTLRVTGSVTSTTKISLSNAGRLEGTGTVSADVDNESGTAAPGIAGEGILNVVGNYRQAEDCTFAVSVFGGAVATRPFNRLNVDGTLELAGEFLLMRGNTTSLQAGDTFDVLDFDAITGSFSRFTLASPGSGLAWDLSQLYLNGTIEVVVPEPTLLSVTAAISVLLRHRRRTKQVA